MIEWIFGIWFLLSSYLIINLYRKILIHERWKDGLQKSLEKALNTMRTIDNRGLFENDDYTGAVFKDLFDAVEEVSLYTNVSPDLIDSNKVELPHGS